MIRRVLSALVPLLIATTLHAQSERDAFDSLNGRVRDAEVALVQLRRFVPPAAESADFIAFLGRDPLQPTVTPLPPARSDASLGVELCRLDASGRGSFADVDALFRRIERQARIIDAEEVDVTPQTDGTVSLRTRIAWVCWDETGVTKATPVASGSVQQRMLADLQQRLDWLTRNSNAIVDARSKAQPNPLHALDAVASSTRGQALALSSFHVADRSFDAEGVTLGDAAFRAMRPMLGDARVTPRGDCRSFALRGRLAAVSSPADVDRTVLVFDRDVDAHCSSPHSAPFSLTLRGTGGELTLRAAQLELPDFFRLLHELTGASYLVRDDVRGSIDGDISNASADMLLERAPADVSGGALHIVRPAHSAALAMHEKTYSGEPLSLELADADVNDVLCMFGKLTGLAFAVPTTFNRRTSAYVRDLPWDHVVDALVASYGLTYRIDGTTVAIGAEPRRDACTSGMTPGRWWKISPEHLAVEDVRVAAVGHNANGEWKALGYAPGSAHDVIVLTRGTRVGDAEVSDIASTAVTFTRDGQTITRTLARAASP